MGAAVRVAPVSTSERKCLLFIWVGITELYWETGGLKARMEFEGIWGLDFGQIGQLQLVSSAQFGLQH